MKNGRKVKSLFATLLAAGSLLMGACIVVWQFEAARPVQAQGENHPLTEDLLRTFTFRNVGAFRMQARASAVAVPAAPPQEHLYTFYLATMSGGVFKTTNGGTTFEPVFDGQERIAVGAIAVSPSDSKVVWVGTGDTRGARSSFPGNGVYKSTDAAATWTNMGLRDSQHVSRIVIDPKNPNIVYVGAMGHLYSPNQERGVFKTANGGRTWDRVLFVSDKVGVIDLVMNPKDPAILYAATYDMERTPWLSRNAGPESAIYKTADGGKSWTKLGGGFPTGRIGKIGLDIYPQNPEILYALVNNDNPGTSGGTPGGCTGGQRAGLIGGEMYRTDTGGRTWTKMNSATVDMSPKGSGYIGSGDEDCDGFSQVRVDPQDDQHVIAVSNEYMASADGGKTWRARSGGGPGLFPGAFGDVRTLWIDPENPRRMISGSDGGFYLSYDGGASSLNIANLPVEEPYSVGFDMDDPYNIYVCIQDHETWKGPSIGPNGHTSLLDWIAISSGDGMHARIDPNDSRWAYTASEWGGLFRTDQKLGYRTNIRPSRPQGQPAYRTIWGTPLHISPHNSSTLYTGGEVLLKSVDKGEHWTEISSDLTTNDGARLYTASGPGVQRSNYWFAISTIAESPVSAGTVWVGTSDGKVQLTRNGGAVWTDLTEPVAQAGAPKNTYISAVVASNYDPARAYVSKDGTKQDDPRPYLYMTNDSGATWTSIAGNLPSGPVHVVWEDNRNPDLLFVGSNAGLFVSINRGKTWVRMKNNIPNVPVLDLAVHPREHDLIVGAFGRGVFVTNIAPLEELNDQVLAEDTYLFEIKPGVQRITRTFGAGDYLFAQGYLQTPNPVNGMAIQYYLRSARNDEVSIVVSDIAGKEMARLRGTATAGINTVVWNMLTPAQGGGRGGGRGGGYAPNLWAPLGDYQVTLEVGGKKLSRTAHVAKTQGWTVGTTPEIIR